MLRLALLLLVAVPAAAQTQMELNEQACAEAQAADDDLNTAYQALMDSIGEAGRRRGFRDSQRAWIAFRDAELDALFYVPPGSTTRREYGSSYDMLRCSELRALTEQRTEALRQLRGPERP